MGLAVRPVALRPLTSLQRNGTSGAVSYDATVLADGPVAYYKTNETSGTVAADSAGLNTGTYTGGFTLAQPGPANQGNCGVALNGSTGYITIPDAAALRLTGDLTLEIWVKPTDLSNYWFLITKDLSNSPRPYEWRLDQTTGLPNLPDSGGNPKVASSGVTAGVWTHLAVTRSGTNATFYLNGSPNGTVTGVTVGTDAGRPVLIGTRDDTFTFLKGSIAKPAIYGSVLSAARIAAHYAAA